MADSESDSYSDFDASIKKSVVGASSAAILKKVAAPANQAECPGSLHPLATRELVAFALDLKCGQEELNAFLVHCPSCGGDAVLLNQLASLQERVKQSTVALSSALSKYDITVQSKELAQNQQSLDAFVLSNVSCVHDASQLRQHCQLQARVTDVLLEAVEKVAPAISATSSRTTFRTDNLDSNGAADQALQRKLALRAADLRLCQDAFDVFLKRNPNCVSSKQLSEELRQLSVHLSEASKSVFDLLSKCNVETHSVEIMTSQATLDSFLQSCPLYYQDSKQLKEQSKLQSHLSELLLLASGA